MANSYEGFTDIPVFSGINQSNDTNLKMQYAVKGYNFFCDKGVLQSAELEQLVEASNHIEPSAEIEEMPSTLAFITKRYKQGESGIIDDDYIYAVMVYGGKIYYRKWSKGLDGGRKFFGSAWVQLTTMHTETSDTEAIGTLEYPRFDFANYELNSLPVILTNEICTAIEGGAEYYAFDNVDFENKLLSARTTGGGVQEAYYTRRDETEVVVSVGTRIFVETPAPVDALLITNNRDGMFAIYSPLDTETLEVAKITVAPNGVDTRFDCIALFNERIFGSGIKTDTDKLMYSAPNNPFCWEQYNAIPENGAGDILVPEWDGDRFISLKPFGNALMCIKKHSIWRLIGTNPAEYTLTKEYGEGTIADASVQVYGGYMYFLSTQGLMYYDGSISRQLKYGSVNFQTTIADLEIEAPVHVSSCMCGDKYIIGGYFDVNTFRSCFVVYSTSEGIFSMLWGTQTSMNAYDGELYFIKGFENRSEEYTGPDVGMFVQTFPDSPSVINFGSGTAREMLWETAWQDLGAKNVIKSEFEVYLCFDKTMNATITIQTEKKVKSKTVTFTAGMAKRVRLNAHGRRFKLKIDAAEMTPSIYPLLDRTWKLQGGIRIYHAFDYD